MVCVNLAPVSVNKNVLEHSSVFLLHVFCGCLHETVAKLSNCIRDKPKIFTVWPFIQKKIFLLLACIASFKI